MTMTFTCPALSNCSGCSPLAPELARQQQQKVELFRRSSPAAKIEAHSLGECGLRSRLDLTWGGNGWGFWNPQKTKITELTNCPQATPELNVFLRELSEIHWPLKKASARLRISPTLQRGIWLDLANEDVKFLFTEKKLLHSLQQLAEVEIGQRRKSLVFVEDRWRLQDPIYAPWVSTFVEGQEMPLWSLIGGFSQTGPKAQATISKILEQLLEKTNCERILEFGAGFGALTLTANQNGKRQVLALELEPRSVAGLQLTLQKNKIQGVDILCGDFQHKTPPVHTVDTYLVNPPRSGVGGLFQNIPTQVRNVIYMSCFPESYFKDCETLSAQGFHPVESHLIDQFPQTPHAEWMSLWQRT